MNNTLSRHLWPAVAGALVSFSVRFFVGDLQIALIGLVAFALVYAAILLLSWVMKWPDAPTVNAVIATVATTFAFLSSHPS